MKPRQPERSHSDVWIWLNALLAAGNRRQNGGMDIDIVESGKNRKHVRRFRARTLFFICTPFSGLLPQNRTDYRGFKEKNLPGIPRDTVFRIHAKSQA